MIAPSKANSTNLPETKQTFGDATGDQSVANKGAVQEVKGDAEQSWGSVKEAVHDKDTQNAPAADTLAHGLRQDVSNAATSVKNGIEQAANDFKK